MLCHARLRVRLKAPAGPAHHPGSPPDTGALRPAALAAQPSGGRSAHQQPQPSLLSTRRTEKAVERTAATVNTLYPNVWTGRAFHGSRFAPIEPALLRPMPR